MSTSSLPFLGDLDDLVVSSESRPYVEEGGVTCWLSAEEAEWKEARVGVFESSTLSFCETILAVNYGFACVRRGKL